MQGGACAHPELREGNLLINATEEDSLNSYPGRCISLLSVRSSGQRLALFYPSLSSLKFTDKEAQNRHMSTFQ